jgi:hypothetical protein
MPSFSFTPGPVDRAGIVSARLGFYPLTALQAAVETALVAVVANARTLRIDAQQHCILIAIGRDFLHDQPVTRGLALLPKLLARAAVERGEASLDRLAKGFLVHVTDHEDAAGAVILNHRGDQSV